jgi:hypothetical protein
VVALRDAEPVRAAGLVGELERKKNCWDDELFVKGTALAVP